MDLEEFIVNIFDDIQDAAMDNCSYKLELTPEQVKELVELWNNMKWFELY